MTHQGQTGVYFDSGGHRLLGTLFLAAGDDPKPTAVLLHGLPGIEKNYDLAHYLRERGWNSLIFHYRGCWGSEGVYTFHTIPDDVRVAVDYLSSGQHPQIDRERLVLVGHSMGGWAAVLSAADDERIRAVAIYGAVSDPANLPISAEFAATEFIPWLPGLTIEAFMAQWAGLDQTDYNPVWQVHRLAPRPLLILHGEQDEAVGPAQSQVLHAQAGDSSHLELHPDANHAFSWHRAWLCDSLFSWLNRLQ